MKMIKFKHFIRRLLTFLFFISLIVLVGIGVYCLTGHTDEFKEIVTGEYNIDKSDVHNGIYSFEEKIGRGFNIYSGCNVSSTYKYIVVINDTYKYYSSSCIYSKMLESGKTEDLKFDKDGDYFFINFKGMKFEKNNSVNSIVEHDNIKTRFNEASFDTIKFVIDYMEKEKIPFDFNTRISGIRSTYNFQFNKNVNGYDINIINLFEENVYQKFIPSLDLFPEFYSVDQKIIIVEKNKNGDKVNENLILINADGDEIFNLNSKLPIVVNGVYLTNDNFINVSMVDYDKYKVVFGYKREFCDEKIDDGISYYEFLIDYDYDKHTFKSPEFNKLGHYSEGCKYINNNYVIEGGK